MSEDKKPAIQDQLKDSKIAKFFKGVRTEFRKIIWPDRETLLKQLLAVVVVTFCAGVLIAVIDFGVQNLIDVIIQAGA